jgi:hypothetical protein
MEDAHLAHETQLVKAALLYADRVTLASPKAYLYASIASFGAGDRRARIDLTAELIGQLPDGQKNAALYKQLRARRQRLSAPERRMLKGLERILEASSEDLIETVDEMLQQAGADELAEAMAAGAVDLHPLTTEDTSAECFSDDVINEMVSVLAESVDATAMSFPLFDDGAGDLMRAMVKEGKLADPHRPRAAEAGIAGRLIGQLEAFPTADMDVILDVRGQLDAPLTRFRSALAKASSEFAAAAWDETFAREVDDLYRVQVAPALRDVNDALDELGARPTLLRLATDAKAQAAVTATIGLAAAGGITHLDLPALVYGSGPALGAAAAAATEGLQRRKVRGEAGRNAFYFLYESNRRLS